MRRTRGSVQLRRALWVSVVVAYAAGCGPQLIARRSGPPPYADTQPIPEPKERQKHVFSETVETSVVRPLLKSFDLLAHLRRAVAKPEAQDVNTFDDVAPSSWFQPRNARQPETPEEIFRGPNEGPGPATDSLVIVGGSGVGVTPAFWVKDARGTRYRLKCDALEFPEMTSAAEVISTKLFYAAGYNTPENHIVYFSRDQLRIGEGAEIEDERGRRVSLTAARLEGFLSRVARSPDGRIRAVASKAISGKIKGPFAWEGRRKDDPNDVIPHEHRRMLRGLYPMAAWLNHLDLKSGNTLDTYLQEGDRGYVRHYLIDFGSTLGSGAIRSHNPRDGAEYDFDLHLVFGRLFAVGLATADWAERPWTVTHPSLGYLSADFDPGEWKPMIPVAPFQSATDRDGYWGAKLVSSFSDEQIEAAVAAGRLSDSTAARTLVEILKTRRDRTAQYWFVRVTPLEQPVIEDDAGVQHLRFVDYARRYGVVPQEGAVYRWEFRHKAVGLTVRGESEGIDGSAARIALPGTAVERARRAQVIHSRDEGNLVAVVTVRAHWPDGRADRAATVYLRLDPATGLYDLVGLEH